MFLPGFIFFVQKTPFFGKVFKLKLFERKGFYQISFYVWNKKVK
nr:hypothetical protein BSM_31130 [uncultured archaeon]